MIPGEALEKMVFSPGTLRGASQVPANGLRQSGGFYRRSVSLRPHGAVEIRMHLFAFFGGTIFRFQRSLR